MKCPVCYSFVELTDDVDVSCQFCREPLTRRGDRLLRTNVRMIEFRSKDGILLLQKECGPTVESRLNYNGTLFKHQPSDDDAFLLTYVPELN